MNPRVLVVDDEVVLCSVLEDLLKLEGCEVATCRDVKSANEELKKQNFDAAMLDIFLPGDPSGFDLARKLLKDYPGTEVILMTGSTNKAALEAASLTGDYTCIDKPFNLEDVLRVVGKTLAASG